MKVEVLELKAVVNFITGIQLGELTIEELEILNNTLKFQSVNVNREMDRRKKSCPRRQSRTAHKQTLLRRVYQKWK
jgi:FtsZ-binding cell division protein ZapB